MQCLLSCVSDDSTTDELKKLESLKELLSKSATLMTGLITEKAKAMVLTQSKNVGEALLVLEDVQFFEPRGRFKLTVTQSSIFIEGKSLSGIFQTDNVSHLACVPSHTSTKKEGPPLSVQ